MDAKEFLEHRGVKGMHWGVRKAEPTQPKPQSQHVVQKPKMSTHDKVTVGLSYAAIILTGAVMINRRKSMNGGHLLASSARNSAQIESLTRTLISDASSFPIKFL